MPKYTHPDALDNGLAHIRTNANVMHVIKTYAVGDSYATVVGNSCGSASMAATDYTLGTSGLNRTLTTASGKTGTASANSGAGPNLHYAFVDSGTSRVLHVTDEPSDQVITSGNPLTFGVTVITATQPT